MKKSVCILLSVLCALMILSLPLLIPSGAMLGQVKWNLMNEMDEASEGWDEGASLITRLFPAARAEAEASFPADAEKSAGTEETAYALPVDFSAGFAPNPACFAQDGYEDDSITVKMETREEDSVTYRIAFVTVKSPTQLRTATAGSLTSSKTAKVSSMAEKHNAILAINGDNFTNNPAKTSFEYRMGEKIRSKANKTKDILIIDENGDFHLFVKSDAAKMKEFNESDRQIINAFTFGPALVIDGTVQKIDKEYGYNPSGREPRMAIGQTGALSYVLVMAEGRSKESEGVTQQELADYMGTLACTQAFNLDGGNSAEMIFNGAFYGARTGNERDQSDIIYFASAVDPSAWQ